jgi:hypothetical protein
LKRAVAACRFVVGWCHDVNRGVMSAEWQRFDRLQREGMDKIAGLADRYIWAVTSLIALVFVVLSIKDIPFDKAIASANPQYLQDLILSIYIVCWALGTKTDTYNQKSVYLVDPLGGKLRLGSIVAVATLAAVSITLLWVRRNELYFSLALAAFTAADIFAWLYLRYGFVRKIIDASRAKYNHDEDYFGLAKLKFIEIAVLGNWKWVRQVFLTAIVACMILSSSLPSFKLEIATIVQKLLSLLSFSGVHNKLSLICKDLNLNIFVAVWDVWNWR